MRVGAWSENTPSEAVLKALLAPWQGKLGAVLGAHQVGWAASERAFVILNHPPAGLQLPSDTLAILGSRDEPNWTGPSGEKLDAAVVESDTLDTRRAYPNTPVTNGALAFVGMGWQRALSRARFDKPYWRLLNGRMGGPWAFNAGDTRLALVKQALSLHSGPWLVCGLPRRPAWRPDFTVFAWLVQSLVGVSMAEWVALAKRPDVLAVTFWCLLQDGDQTGFGIFKPKGSTYVLTTVGRALWRALMNDRRYPVITA